MLRFTRTFTMLALMLLLLSACQPLIVPVPVVMPSGTPPQAVANLTFAPVTKLMTTPLFTLTIALGEPRNVGSGALGIRYVSYFTGGAVTGTTFTGEVLANGENWYLIRLDNVAELVIQGAVQTAEGEQIAFKALGFSRIDPASKAQVLAGELVDPAAALFHGVTFFTTDAPQYAWLNDCVTMTTFTYDLKQVQIAVYNSDSSSD